MGVKVDKFREKENQKGIEIREKRERGQKDMETWRDRKNRGGRYNNNQGREIKEKKIGEKERKY